MHYLLKTLPQSEKIIEIEVCKIMAKLAKKVFYHTFLLPFQVRNATVVGRPNFIRENASADIASRVQEGGREREKRATGVLPPRRTPPARAPETELK